MLMGMFEWWFGVKKLDSRSNQHACEKLRASSTILYGVLLRALYKLISKIGNFEVTYVALL